MSSPWEGFCHYCSALPLGSVSDTTDLERLLAACWHELDGDDGGMEGYKLLGRMEEAAWTPPVLTFTIERHGGTVMGASRAFVIEFYGGDGMTINKQVVTAEVIRRIPVVAVLTDIAVQKGPDLAKRIIEELRQIGCGRAGA